MAIDFSSRVNPARSGFCARLALCLSWSEQPVLVPDPTQLPLASAAGKLKDIRRNSLVKSGENSGFINQPLMTGSAVRWGISASPGSPGQQPQPLLWHLLGMGLWQLVWGTCGSRVSPSALGHSCCTGGSGWDTSSLLLLPPLRWGRAWGWMEPEAAVPSVSFLSPPCPSCPLVRVLQPDRQ